MKTSLCPLPTIVIALMFSPAVGRAADGLFTVDPRALVSRADLTYDKQVDRSEAGLPIGNGRMGSLVWTTPSELKFQINRVDVFGSNCASDSFPERHTDYCGGCGFVDINLGGPGGLAFLKDHTLQHLSCYDGLLKVEEGKVFEAQVLAWNEQDVMAIQLIDRRAQVFKKTIKLRMLRPAVQKQGNHTATSKLGIRDGRIVLTQEFVEGDYYCGSAVVIGVVGGNAGATLAGDQEVQLVVGYGAGTFNVLVASAASFDRKEDLVAAAIGHLDAAAAKGFAAMYASNQQWWRDFWSKSFVHLHSADGVADNVEANYNYYLYLMASTSRGEFPTKFNGMLWTTGGDKRQWGGRFWGANQSCLYNNALLAANHAELLNPMFDMYSAMAASCAVAAREQWGSQGIFLPETVAFDGLPPLPDDIAAEMRDLYLLRKPWEQRSKRFLDYAAVKQGYDSRWNFIGPGRWVDGRFVFQDRGDGPYGPVTHIFSRGAKIAYQYWLRYEYTLDETWLRDRAYPILKGVAEFYRNFPNVKRGDDGKYHIWHVNSNEPLKGGRDTDEEISSMMAMMPVVIRASEILGLDAAMRPVWKEFLDNLAPLPRSDNPDTASTRPRSGPPVWVKGLNPVVRGNPGSLPDGNTMPMWFFDLCTLESDPQTQAIGQATLSAFVPNGGGAGRSPGVLSKIGLTAAVMGRADAVKRLIPGQLQSSGSAALANRMDLREGPQTQTVQRLGNAADATHTALCQDLPAGPGKPAVLRIFPAWPTEWDAEFTLLCRGGFLVTSALRGGQIEFIELNSQLGGECRLRNPWGEGAVTVYRNGRKSESPRGALLTLNTAKGEDLVVVRPETTPENFKRVVAVK